MSIAAIIVAAGRGTRAGGGVPKQWQMLAGRPVLHHAVQAFEGLVDHVVVAIHPDDADRATGLAAEIVIGGDSRSDTVARALGALEGRNVSKVLIHDAARPLVSRAVISSVIDALERHSGAAPALPVSDALWRGHEGVVSGTAPRDGLWRAQTPQGFHFDAILGAHRAHPGGAADDVEVARWAGHEVAIVPGDEDNLKVTFPGDLERAERIMKGRE